MTNAKTHIAPAEKPKNAAARVVSKSAGSPVPRGPEGDVVFVAFMILPVAAQR